MSELVLNQGGKSIEVSTHIGRLRAEPDTGLVTGSEH